MSTDFKHAPADQVLSLDDYLKIASICVGLGIGKIRITGGEPTLYPHLDQLIRGLGRLPINDMAMTTNGSRLDEQSLARWREAGLRRITLSLDSLRPERMALIARSEASPEPVLRAIAIANRLGYEGTKVNCVIRRGMNEDEIPGFAELAREHGIEVRFIEFMPLDSERQWATEDVVSGEEIITIAGTRHELVAEDPGSGGGASGGGASGGGTSRTYAFADGSPGRIGVIASVSQPFCESCSRLRLTADGRIRPCLFSDREWDLRPLLRAGAMDSRIRRFIIDAAWTKPHGHEIGSPVFSPPDRTMPDIGG